MKAVTWQGPENVVVDEVPDPRIEATTDAIIKVTSTAICGSDLHLGSADETSMNRGDVLGHEAVGIVEEVGDDVQHVEPGDRVVVPFSISCGRCYMCRRHFFAHCETARLPGQGDGAELFGHTRLEGGVTGAQAEYWRVPQAHFGPVQVPAEHPDERYLYLSDVLPTAWQAVKYAAIPARGSVAVFGLGPVGQFCVRIARLQGIDRVFGIDTAPARLALAEQYGAEAVDSATVDDVPAYLRNRTGGRGPDAVVDAAVDAIGMRAHAAGDSSPRDTAVSPPTTGTGNATQSGSDRLRALRDAISSVRCAGTVSISGVDASLGTKLPIMNMFDKGIQLRMGQANVRRWVADLLPLVINEDRLGTEDLATHRLPLAHAEHAYELFQKKDEAIKVVMDPWTADA